MKVVIVNHNGFWDGIGFTEKSYWKAVVFESEAEAAETLEGLSYTWAGGAETMDYKEFLAVFGEASK